VSKAFIGVVRAGIEKKMGWEENMMIWKNKWWMKRKRWKNQ